MFATRSPRRAWRSRYSPCRPSVRASPNPLRNQTRLRAKQRRITIHRPWRGSPLRHRYEKRCRPSNRTPRQGAWQTPGPGPCKDCVSKVADSVRRPVCSHSPTLRRLPRRRLPDSETARRSRAGTQRATNSSGATCQRPIGRSSRCRGHGWRHRGLWTRCRWSARRRQPAAAARRPT